MFTLEIDDIFSLSAIICRGIISGHPFVDGNKRAGIQATDLFLRKNGYFLEMTVDEGVRFALSIAQGESNLKTIKEWLELHSKQL